jgi:hypothetical protein
MKNKGQFFLIATFIVITLFLSLTLVYNSADSPVGDPNIDSIAHNLKFEGVQIINNGYYNNLNYQQITDNLKAFSNATSKSFKVYDIVILTVSDDKSQRNAYQYANGNVIDISQNATLIGNVLTLDLNSLEFNFNVSKGYNFFVIVINEKQNERYISSE